MKQIDFQETIATQTRRIMPFDCNSYGFLFGGKLTAWLDELTSISASKFCHQKTVTASIDELYFIQSVQVDDMLYLESYVTGSGNRSIEVFAKVIGENIITGEQYLASISFWTFVIIDEQQPLQYTIATSNDDLLIQEYQQRTQQVRQKRFDRHDLIEQLKSTLKGASL